MKNKKVYNLKTLYSNETQLERYLRLTVGENASIRNLIVHELILGLCTGLPGILGLGIRNKLYPLFFKTFSKKTAIGKNVILRCPRNIHLGHQVVIDDFVQLIATSKIKTAISIGDGSFVRSFAMVNSGPPEGFVHVGKNSSIGQGALLYGNGGLSIGENVMIAGQAAIIASIHIYNEKDIPMNDQGYEARGITIGDNVWIGAGAKILDGISIGSGAIIGANAVVNRSVDPGDHVGGIPAKKLKSRD